MMTAYEQGFLTKCAEYGLQYETAVALLKIAQSPDPNVSSSGKIVSPSEEGYDPNVTANDTPFRQGMNQFNFAPPGETGDPFAGQGAPQQSIGDWWKGMDQNARKDLLARNNVSVADFNKMTPAERGKMLKGFRGQVGQIGPKPTQPPAFQPNAQQQQMMSQWNGGTTQQRQQSLQRMGMTEAQFNAMGDEAKYNTLQQMRENAIARRQQGQQRTNVASQLAGQRQPKPTDMVSYNGSMIDRASYDRIMADKAKEITPQQASANLDKVRGLGFRVAYNDQQKRYSQTVARQPRDANGNLRTIDLAGRPTSPYASRQGVRGIPRAAGT